MTDPNTFPLKRGDTRPPIIADLADAGTPVQLAGATVRFVLVDALSRVVIINALAVILDLTHATVCYFWQAIDTDRTGEYLAEWHVTYADGGKQTFPSAGYNTVSISPRLAE